MALIHHTWIPPGIEDALLCLIDPFFCGQRWSWLAAGPGGVIPSLAQRWEADSVQPPLTRDLVLGLGIARLAALLEDKEAREKIQRIALDLVSREAKRTIPGSESKPVH